MGRVRRLLNRIFVPHFHNFTLLEVVLTVFWRFQELKWSLQSISGVFLCILSFKTLQNTLWDFQKSDFMNVWAVSAAVTVPRSDLSARSSGQSVAKSVVTESSGIKGWSLGRILWGFLCRILSGNADHVKLNFCAISSRWDDKIYPKIKRNSIGLFSSWASEGNDEFSSISKLKKRSVKVGKGVGSSVGSSLGLSVSIGLEIQVLLQEGAQKRQGIQIWEGAKTVKNRVAIAFRNFVLFELKNCTDSV